MALIDALMAGQQFVSGMQQQQQMAREYRDRMAMLARQEERAMRQEERDIMADFRAQELQDFNMELARSAEGRAVSAEERAVKADEIAAREANQRIERNNLEIARLEREAERAPTLEAQQDALFEIQRMTAENEQLAASLNLKITQGQLAAQQSAAATQQELSGVQTALTRVARQVQVDPASLTAQQALAAEKIMYDFIDRNPNQVQALSPYYNTFFNALEMAEDAKGSLLTKRGVRSKYKEQYAMEGNPWTEYGRTTLPRIEYRTGLEEALAPVEEYRNLRDRRENFLSLIGQPIAFSMTSGFPQED